MTSLLKRVKAQHTAKKVCLYYTLLTYCLTWLRLIVGCWDCMDTFGMEGEG